MQSWFTNPDRSSSSSPVTSAPAGSGSSAEAGHSSKQHQSGHTSSGNLDDAGEKNDSLSEADRLMPSASTVSVSSSVNTDTETTILISPNSSTTTTTTTSAAAAAKTGEFSSSSDLNTIVTDDVIVNSESSSTSSESISHLDDFKRTSQDKLIGKNSVSTTNHNIPCKKSIALADDADSDLHDVELIRTKRVVYSIKLFYFIDVMLAIAFFSPMVGIYWYCSWSFLDKYFLSDPQDENLSSFLSYAVGLLFLLPSYVFQQDIKKCYNFFKKFGLFGALMRFVFRNLYMYFISFAFVFQWRGLWNICETFIFDDLLRQMCLAIGAIIFFCFAGSTGSLVSTPFILYRDDLNDPFTSESRFKFKSISPYLQYLIDFVLGELIECFLLVLAWRGVGNAYDRYIFQSEVGKSVICSFTVSHLVFLLIAFSEHKIVERALRMSTVPRLIVENFFNLIMFLSCVLIWKFYWDLIDNYLLSEDYALAVYTVGHFTTFFLSILLNVTFLLAGPGTSIMDGEQTKRETNIYFKINYLSAIFKKRAKRHQIYQQQRRQLRNQSV